jgi:phosphate transport system protein
VWQLQVEPYRNNRILGGIMMRHSFQSQLIRMQDQVVQMGELVLQMVEQAVRALTTGDINLATQVIAMDDRVDHFMLDLEVESLQFFALQQPFARDLRTVATTLKLVTDLERIGDHATDIAEIVQELKIRPTLAQVAQIEQMSTAACFMVDQSLQAFRRQDQEAARTMTRLDDQIDLTYRLVFDDLVDVMQKDPTLVREATLLLHVAMNLERIGDHATNLGEWVVYMLTGQLEDLNG